MRGSPLQKKGGKELEESGRITRINPASTLVKMSVHNLEKVFKPASIAVLGRCSRSDGLANTLIGNLKKGGFTGGIFPVLPRCEQPSSLQAYPALASIGKPIDLALIALPLDAVPAAIRECGEARVAGAIVFNDVCAGHGTELTR